MNHKNKYRFIYDNNHDYGDERIDPFLFIKSIANKKINALDDFIIENQKKYENIYCLNCRKNKYKIIINYQNLSSIPLFKDKFTISFYCVNCCKHANETSFHEVIIFTMKY